MELYLRKKDGKDKKYQQQIVLFEDRSKTEFKGSAHFKDICVIRLLCEVMDKNGDGKTFFLFEHERLATSGRFIKVCELEDR